MSEIFIKAKNMTIFEAEAEIRKVWGGTAELTRKDYPSEGYSQWFVGVPDRNYQNYVAEMGAAGLVIQPLNKPMHQIDMPPVVRQEGSTIQATMKMMSLCVDKIDEMTVQTITDVAKEHGITNVTLFEKDFVLSAVRNELKRREALGETSNDHNAFDELYDHCCTLFALICADHPEIAWKSLKHPDGTTYNGMFICGLLTPYGQVEYVMNVEPYWNMIQAQELPTAPDWDGHTPKMALERIAQMAMDRFVKPCGGIVE